MTETNRTRNPSATPEERHAAMPVARPRRDLTGEVFGRLKVLGDPRRDSGMTRWACDCECGETVFPRGTHLTTGATSSCGCFSRERVTTHGLFRAEGYTHDSWRAMRSRTGSPNDPDFPSYGGAGVTCCDRWSDFGAFFADMGRRPRGYTLDRYRPDWKPGDEPLPYSPSTCRWATRQQQQENRSVNRWLTLDGRTQTAEAWSRDLSIPSSTISTRLSRGLSDAQALARRARS